MKKSIWLLMLAGTLLASGCGKNSPTHANEATLDELNRDLSAIVIHSGGRLPGSNELNQFLAATGKTFPSPPTGKKIVLDPAAKKFVIQDQ